MVSMSACPLIIGHENIQQFSSSKLMNISYQKPSARCIFLIESMGCLFGGSFPSLYQITNSMT